MNQRVEPLAEFPGMYGPYTLAERVVQKIWQRRDFAQESLRLVDGRELQIRSPGSWNLQGGPDFLNARLVIDGQPLGGDVEVHFRVGDWIAHGHGANPAYDRVVLHVVLFPPAPGARLPLRSDGLEMPTLVLLPFLQRSLEECAADDALERLTERDLTDRIAGLARLDPEVRRRCLRESARDRWLGKVRFARLRVERLGWEEAAHHSALEILGYSRNRAPMLATAIAFPLVRWREGVDLDELFRLQGDRWQCHGIRPANHPFARLRHYGDWVRSCPDWPDRLEAMLPPCSPPVEPDLPTRQARRRLDLPARREFLAREIVHGSVGGTRFDTLVCDGFLPLLAARHTGFGADWWFHWNLGDVPDNVRHALQSLGWGGVSGEGLSHGWAQGFLGWNLAQQGGASP